MRFKRILAVLLGVAMLVCFAGCNNEPNAPDTNDIGVATQNPQVPDTAGMLLLSMNAEVKIYYDAGGLVMHVEAANELGQELLAACNIPKRVTCNTAVSTLVSAALKNAMSSGNALLIKQALGSASPSAKFLEDILLNAEAAAPNIAVVLAEAASLSAEGYLAPDTVKTVFLKSTGLEEAAIKMDETITDGLYYISLTRDGITEEYTVDADTGSMTRMESEPVIEVDTTEGFPEGYYEPALDETEPVWEDPALDEPSPGTLGDEPFGGVATSNAATGSAQT